MKKFFGWLFGILIVLAVLGLAVFWGIGFYLSPQDSLQKADAIVVVSGGKTQSRAAKGIDPYKEGYAPKIIFSGAALDEGPSNAFAMRDLALSEGVPAKSILIDEKSQNTYENAVNSKTILDELQAKK